MDLCIYGPLEDVAEAGAAVLLEASIYIYIYIYNVYVYIYIYIRIYNVRGEG